MTSLKSGGLCVINTHTNTHTWLCLCSDFPHVKFSSCVHLFLISVSVTVCRESKENGLIQCSVWPSGDHFINVTQHPDFRRFSEFSPKRCMQYKAKISELDCVRTDKQ